MLIELLHSQYILDSQKLYVYRAVVVALSIVFYNVFNSSLLYGPSCCQAGARVFQLLSSHYIAATKTARARRHHAGGRRRVAWRGGSTTKSARPKGAACIAQLLSGFASKEALSYCIHTLPSWAIRCLNFWYMRARDSTRVEASARASRERWPVGVRPPGPLEHRARARSGASSSRARRARLSYCSARFSRVLPPKLGRGIPIQSQHCVQCQCYTNYNYVYYEVN